MKDERELILDIGSASIGAAIATTSRKGHPIISQVKRVPIGGAKSDSANLRARLGESLKALLTVFQKEPGFKSVQVVLASPWYQSTVRTISSKANKPVKVSIGTVARAVKQYREKEKGAFPEGRRNLESVVTQVYVNGYQTLLTRPVHGTALRIQLYESVSDADFTRLVEDTVKGVFHGARVSFHSLPLVTFVVLRALRDEQAFMIVDIGGEVTDLAIIHRDGLTFLASFPRGTKALVRDIGASTDGAAEAVPSRLSLYARGELSAEETASFAPLFEKAAAAWNADLQKALDKAVAETPVPRAVFITAGPEELSWFSKVLDTTHKIFPARVIPITPNFFQSAVGLGDEASYDAFLSLEALFFHTEKKELIEA